MTAVSSTAQNFNTPLHLLCKNKSVTAEMIQALGALHPAAAGDKDEVRSLLPATRARHDRRLVHCAEWQHTAARSLPKNECHGRDDPRSRRAPSGGGRREGSGAFAAARATRAM